MRMRWETIVRQLEGLDCYLNWREGRKHPR